VLQPANGAYYLPARFDQDTTDTGYSMAFVWSKHRLCGVFSSIAMSAPLHSAS
jgi:hypothetical protein